MCSDVIPCDSMCHKGLLSGIRLASCGGQSTTISASGSEGIVANLADLHRLGASLGHDEDESEEGSVYWANSRTAFDHAFGDV